MPANWAFAAAVPPVPVRNMPPTVPTVSTLLREICRGPPAGPAMKLLPWLDQPRLPGSAPSLSKNSPATTT